MDKTLAAAQIIATARRNRSRLGSLPSELAPQTEADGYRIQRAVHDLLLPQVGAMIGYKIGCTSAVMQQYLNIPSAARHWLAVLRLAPWPLALSAAPHHL
jgi:2-keto-4-pentenoate hydratase